MEAKVLPVREDRSWTSLTAAFADNGIAGHRTRNERNTRGTRRTRCAKCTKFLGLLCFLCSFPVILAAMFSYRTAGESHGPALIALVEGLPAHLPVDFD